MKIVYCVGSFINKGGMEQVLENKVNYFIKSLGYEIHIIMEDQKDLPICYNFNEKVVFHDMAISKLNKKVIKGLTFLTNILKLRRLYSKLLSDIKPDVVIVCERGYLDFVIPFINKEIPKIREFHFAKEAVKVHAGLMKPFSKKLIHLLRYSLLFKMFSKYEYLVLLTNRDKINGKYDTKIEVIPNMLELGLPARISNLKSTRVISVGSMHDTRKAFDVQIRLWKDIVKIHPDWILDIYGDGVEKNNLQKLIDELNLSSNVILHGNSNTMEKNYLNASIFLFTSKAEGLPMVLIEAISYGIPCISYDCPTGPSDIITNKEDGFLIEENNVTALKEKLLFLIENEKNRLIMGKAARSNAERFTLINVSKLWVSLFNKISS
jgi:glycosyltransferase involved in cell wall biosynthesis